VISVSLLGGTRNRPETGHRPPAFITLEIRSSVVGAEDERTVEVRDELVAVR
jgi:hypothetical protein